MKFKLVSPYQPAGDQPQAIASLTKGIQKGAVNQVLLGVTGSGKTFSLAHVIENIGWPVLVVSHNKTLAAQLYQEFKSFFPGNAVSYFVSYYDYYQPEAYIPQTDTYIDKETEINQELDKLRLAATTNILTRNDTIVVASVSCIYNIGSPQEYERLVLALGTGVFLPRNELFRRLIDLQYERSDYGFHRGSFRVRGEMIDIFPAYEDSAIRIEMQGDSIKRLYQLDPVSGKKTNDLLTAAIYPAKHYMTNPKTYPKVFDQIRTDLEVHVALLKKKGKMLEAHRLAQRVTYDLEMIEQMGYVNGIENYSRYFDNRNPGDPPYTLFDYFQNRYGNKWLLCIDESHMTIPQLRGMYNGDRARKETLINYGFRLPAAFDNRPLRFDEVVTRFPHTIYVSATPEKWELDKGRDSGIVEQLVRPTGLVDPEIIIRPIEGQIDDLISEVEKRVSIGQRVLVTTLTKRMSEDLTRFMAEKNIKVQYLHSDIETLERSDILEQLRRGAYDVVVGINLLREGLDLPEVSLVAILDADKAGFLRSRTALIQTMGRAARHINGQVILYADNQTMAMKQAIEEVTRRREIQLAYNKKQGIIPTSISKPIRDRLSTEEFSEEEEHGHRKRKRAVLDESIDIDSLTPFDRQKLIKRLTAEMRFCAKELDFERAVLLRDKIKTLQEKK